MSGVGPGTVLGGRYAVVRRLAERDGAQLWQAEDSTLRREVSVLVVPAGHLQAAALLDAARRSAVVEGAGLARVHDVGQSEGAAWVVEESLAGSRSLAELANDGGMPAEEVRRVVGLASRGLEAARLRGLHHEALSPRSVVRTPDGDVRVLGLATSAALRGVEAEDADAASRDDAVGLVALLYAGLTGRWPLDTDGGGLAPAPAYGTGPAAPSEVAAGVPGDLDALCRLTLTAHRGPRTPGELARQIAPWSPAPVEGVGGARRVDVDDEALTATGTAGRAAVAAGTAATGAGSTKELPVLGGEAGGDEIRASGTAAAGAAGPTAAEAAGATAAGAAGATAAAGAAPGTEARDGIPAHGADGLGTGPGAGPETPSDEGSTAGVGAALGTATAATKEAVGSVSDKVGGLARSAAQRVGDRRAARAAAAEWTEDHRVHLADTLTQAPSDEEEIEPPVPLLDPGSVGPLDRDESRLALAIVAALLVVALVVGIWGLTRIGSGVDLGLGADPAQTTLATTDKAAPSATATTTAGGATSATAGLEDLGILSARAYDPEGDDKENDAAVGRVYDGDKSTVWTSEGYESPNLGGIKDGVGVILDLGSNARPRRVEVTQTTASSYTVYLNDERSRNGATKVGTSSSTGTTTFDVPNGKAGQYLIVWFTQVAKADDGRYRASLAEVAVQGEG